MRRRREFDGAAEALAVRFEEALEGRTRSASAASLRAFWRRRCGRSAFDVDGASGGFEAPAAFAASIPAIGPPPALVVVNVPLLELARAFSSIAFAEKYPSRNLIAPATLLLMLDEREKSLLAARTAARALAPQHDTHIVADAFDRKALIGGDRTIIAQHSRFEALEISRLGFSGEVVGFGEVCGLATRLANHRLPICMKTLC
jgi:hypothetical protein